MESEAQVETLKKILKDKEGEITEVNNQLRQAKENAIKEYHDSDDLLRELVGSFANGFDDCFRQVKASFLELDLSCISIDAGGQTPTRPADSEGTDELFVDNATVNLKGDGDAFPSEQEKLVEDGTCQSEEVQIMEEKKEDTPTVQ